MSPGGSLAPREHFPALERYTYLNAASIALMPLPILKAKHAFEERIAAAGTISLDEEAEAKALNVPRRIAGRLLGTGEDNIAIVTNATEALAQLAWGLKPGRGSNVVSIDIEFPSVTYPWLRVAQDTGVEVRLVKAVKDPAALTFDDIAAAVDDKTAVLCVSHVQYATGHRFCPKALSDLAHSHGAVCIIDATQSAGVVPMDVERWGVDALMASGYKWLCGPFGAAVLYVKPELRDRLAPPVVGWLSNEDPFAFDATRIFYARSGRRFEAGTPSYGSGYGLGEVMNYLMDLGIEKCLAHVHGLTRRLREGLERLGAEVVTPADDASRAGVLAARFPGRKAEAVAGELNRRGIVVSPRFGAVRFAPHVYNDEEDIEKALREVRRIVT
ncbi:MAG: aminotransferase class V-fold PLP-dependent enzyme [Firmicutes bacterium]|nr:aminotransferase class V-fold PLP-dependent enzyme [Bacillota bacterium]